MLRRVDATEQICYKSMEIVIFSSDFISEALEHVDARTGSLKPEITSASFICQINCWRFSELVITICHLTARNRITSITATRTERARSSAMHRELIQNVLISVFIHN